MEVPLSFVRKLSLEEMALRRVVATSWTGAYISASMEEVPDETYIGKWWKLKEEWREMAAKVTEEVSALVLPESPKKRMMEVVRPIGAEIREWNICTRDYLSDSGESRLGSILNRFLWPENSGQSDSDSSDTRRYLDARIFEQVCWTCLGTINYRRTAEGLARSEILDVEKRYRLACLFCSEDIIRELWEELPEEIRGKFYDESYVGPFLRVVIERKMECYWTYILKGEESKLIHALRNSYFNPNYSFDQHAFRISACSGNKAATKYFFQKLTFEQRDHILIDTALSVVTLRSSWSYENLSFPEKSLSDILGYLLSVMSPEQQMQVFKERPCQILSCFMDWPWQDFFMDIADVMRDADPEIDYYTLTNSVCHSISNADFCIPSFIQKFFLRIPIDFREYFLMHFLNQVTRFSYYEIGGTIKVLFRNVSPENREQFFCSLWFVRLLDSLVRMDEWRLVDLCIREAAPSKDDRERLKETVFEDISVEFDNEALSKLKQSFELLDETDES